ncbi:calcium-binding protein [Mesorhizobium sp. LHD-90]|uniref:beta strand repeat-containing protein n=1 Tax=Mesorhizobium sp. LHD-90 TaxID=3071414 RepID=UPI0027E17312|nr:calcium-binding protein [Mesorhizobium sp. LHD-90]MDQ6434367.1 calcium-binding protein [Mesorhizobium sp. LHD-90]
MPTFIVDPNATETGNVFNTIQGAIDASQDGDVIQVVAGVFNENLTINKAVTIEGAQSGVTGADGARDVASGLGETTIVGRSSVTATSAATIDGVRFLNDATTTGGGPSAPALWIANGAGHSVANSIFWSEVAGGANGVDDRAIGMGPIATGSVTIANNYIGGEGGKYGDAAWGRGIWSDGGGIALEVSGNTFDSTRTSINVDAFDPTKVVINGNEFKLAGTAISVGTPTSSTLGGIENNNFGDADTDLNLKNVPTGMTVDLSTAGNTSSAGTFFIDGPAGPTTFVGGATDDAYVGRAGTDNINTGAGNDYIFASAGGDKVDGGDGVDTLDMSAAGSGGAFVDLSAGLGFSSVTGTMMISSIENVKGSAGNDGLFGSSADNVVYASAGADTIDGRGGNDTFDASSATSSVTIDLNAGTASGGATASLTSIENASGGSENDHFTGTAGNNTFNGGAGVDTYNVNDNANSAGIEWNGDHFEITTGAGATDTLTSVEKAEFNDGNVWLVHDSAELANALASAGTGDKVLLASGQYTGNFSVAADGVSIESATGNAGDVVFNGTFKTDNGIASGTHISDWVKTATAYTGAAGNGITVTGDDVTIKNITVSGYYSGIGLATSDGLTLDGVVLTDNLFGIYNNSVASAVTNFTMTGGTISHSFQGISFDAATGSEFSGVLIDGTHFDDLTWKGIYVERLDDAVLKDIVMTNVGQFGRIPTYSGVGTDGSGIELNLKYGDYSGIVILNPTLTNVGLSNGGGSPHVNGAAIAIKARMDGSYAGNPATLDDVQIIGGSINGTSTGIRIGEPNKVQTGPTNVTVDGVDITDQALGHYDNQSQAVLIVNLSDDDDIIVTNANASGPIAYAALGGQDQVAGGKGDDIISGGDGNDTLDGGLGADNLDGGAGDDTFIADGSDFIIEALGGGTDLVKSAVTISLAANVENLTLTGSDSVDGTGNGDNNVVTGNSGNNTLSGLGGQDQLVGGDGADTLNGGDDDDLLEGGVGADALNGGNGFDTATYAASTASVNVNMAGASTGGDATGDTFNSIENLIGSAFADILVGDAGDNTIDGGAGGDYLFGGAGQDTASYKGSVAGVTVNLETGAASGGSADGDFVFEFERVLGSNFKDTLTGNSVANVLTGLDGNDVLNGRGGADIMAGGAGDDIYYVDNAADQVFEAAGDGDDTVTANTSYVLDAGVEAELLRTTSNGGTAAINLTGNTLAQEIMGNAGKNIIHDGGAGLADTLRGLGGDDTYRIFNAGDVIIETVTQGAADRVMSAVDYALNAGAHIELITTNGSTGTSGIDLTGNEVGQGLLGNAGANKLDGQGGDDTINGLSGNDTLTGGTGADVFVFSTALNASTNVDKIIDFDVTDDAIHLENAVFTALAAIGSLDADLFKDVATSARDADDVVLYNSSSGGLFYDADGQGGAAAIKFASLSTGLNLTAADFVVI